jgi:hypothetical protein
VRQTESVGKKPSKSDRNGTRIHLLYFDTEILFFARQERDRQGFGAGSYVRFYLCVLLLFLFTRAVRQLFFTSSSERSA